MSDSPNASNIQVYTLQQQNKKSKKDAPLARGTGAENDSDTWEVEKILNKKKFKGRIYYEVKWVGCSKPTWERSDNCNCDLLIKEYEERVKRQSVDEEDDEWEVEKILDKRTLHDKTIEYLVKWKNWNGDDQWIREEDCLCVNLIAAYENPKLRKMWNFQGSNPNLWLDRDVIFDYMHSYIEKKKVSANLMKFENDFPESEQPLQLEEGLNIGPLCYKDHWYLVVILINHICVSKRLLVGDPLNTLFGSPEIKTHPVFKRLRNLYPRIPAKPLTLTPMDRSDVCGYYILAAFERAIFVYDKRASFVTEKLYFDYARPELLRESLRPETEHEFSVALPVSGTYLTGPRCEFCDEFFEHSKLVDKHIKKQHFS